MSAIQQQICSIKKVGHTFVFSSPEDAALMGWTANITIEFQILRNVKLWTKPRTSLAGRGSAHFDKIWKGWDPSLKKPELFMSANSGYRVIIMASLNCMKFYWGISVCGDKLRILIFYPTKGTLSLNTNIDVWLSSANKPCPISHWIVTKSWPFAGQMKTLIPEWLKSKKRMRGECCWVPLKRRGKKTKKKREEKIWNKKGRKLWLQWWRISGNNELITLIRSISFNFHSS